MSATPWQLPPNLEEACLLGVISQSEANQIEDFAMTVPLDQCWTLPQELNKAASRLWLWEVPQVGPTQ